MLASRGAPAQGRREKVSALAQEAALAFFVPCCTRGLLSYCQLLWCQRVSKQWNADVLVALRHLSCLSFRASFVDGALPPPRADAPGAYYVLHHRNSRRALSRGQASQEVTLDECPAEVTDVAIALERVGPSNLEHLDLSHATGLHRELPKGFSDDLFLREDTKTWVDQIKKSSKTKYAISLSRRPRPPALALSLASLAFCATDSGHMHPGNKFCRIWQ
jgi:hypothetical protein